MNALRRLPPLETALVVVAIVLLGFAGVARQAAQEQPVDSYSSYDAASGGYRAWYELLEREGVRVARFERQPAFLGGAQDTLVWAEPMGGSAASAGDIAALEAWVKGGGRLLYLGYDDEAAKQGVLALPKTTGATHAVRDATFAGALGATGLRRVAWSAAPRRFAAKAKAAVLARDASGALALEYAYGRGRVTAIVDEGPFRNASLVSADDARFAYAVGRPARAGGTVAFNEALHGHLVPEHWWEIVPRPFLVGVIVAAFALLLAFAGAAIRLGPPLVPPPLRDPTSLEFLDSVAGLLERGRGARQAVLDAVRSTKRVVAVAVGVPDDAPNETIAARIEPAEFRAAFGALVAFEHPDDPTDATLLRVAVLAQALRKEYAPHAGSRR